MLGVAAAFSLVVVVGYGAWRITQRGDLDEAQPADAIVVLGAAQYDGHPSPVFEARISHAVDLWHADIAPFLVVTGGGQPGDRTTEAATARAWAVEHGVPDAAILGDDEARNTQESIAAVADVLRRNGLRSAVFVSDRTHMLRVLRMAKDQGITAFGSPTESSPSDHSTGSRLEATIHELGALLVYGLSGSLAEEAPASAPASVVNEPRSVAVPPAAPPAEPPAEP